MTSTSSVKWAKGRGKLGFLRPLFGVWKATADSPTGTVTCVRTFEPVLRGRYVRLSAIWNMRAGVYEELALYGVRGDGQIGFWSFASDGGHSEGVRSDASDIHSEAISFESRMPAGLARMAYWPDDRQGLHWVVEARTKHGWKRFTHHHYVAGR